LSLADQIEADATAVLLNEAEFAEPVTVTPVGGSPTATSALVIRRQGDLLEDRDGRGAKTRATVHLDAALARPAISDVLSFPHKKGDTGVNWKVVEPATWQAGLWKVEVERYDPVEKSGRVYRARR